MDFASADLAPYFNGYDGKMGHAAVYLSRWDWKLTHWWKGLSIVQGLSLTTYNKFNYIVFNVVF